MSLLNSIIKKFIADQLFLCYLIYCIFICLDLPAILQDPHIAILVLKVSKKFSDMPAPFFLSLIYKRVRHQAAIPDVCTAAIRVNCITVRGLCGGSRIEFEPFDQAFNR